jgi:[ribosomal protein S18]-alanine N-acetyltransferase
VAVIRAMARDDLDAVRRLEIATPEAPHWALAVYEGFLLAESPVKRIFVAEDGGRILGFTAAQVVGDVCELESIVVDVAARRTGLGAALLAALKEWARQSGAIRVELEVRAGNTSGVAFYERAGFSTDSRRRSYYREPDEDAVLMSCPLQPNHAS